MARDWKLVSSKFLIVKSVMLGFYERWSGTQSCTRSETTVYLSEPKDATGEFVIRIFPA